MNRRTAFALLLVACGSGGVLACGGSTTNVTGPEDGSADAPRPVCPPDCPSEDGGLPVIDATVDSGAEVNATVPEDTSTSEDSGSAMTNDGGLDSGQPSTDSGTDSGEPSADSGTDSGEPSADSGTDSGQPTLDSGTDSGQPSTDSGTDSGQPATDSGQPATDSGTDSGEPDSGTDSGELLDSGGIDSATADAGSDAEVTIPEGGLPQTPGEVTCGTNQTCAVPANQCCLETDGGGVCVASGSTCPTLSISVQCNEAADCTGGDLCCVSIDIASRSATAACQAGPCGTAATGKAQACRTDQECGADGPCTVQDCAGLTLELCGQPDFYDVYKCTPE